jgi:hypothetical protein
MFFEAKELLAPPLARAAYSDRTAWLMAEMSRLAYERFEDDEGLLDTVANSLSELDDVARIKEELAHFVAKLLKPGGTNRLIQLLARAGFDLVATFNVGGTQAFLAKRDSDRMAVLAFRGTEMNFEDIMSDLNARFYQRGGSQVHDGFRQAFELVEPLICAAVAQLGDYKLYVTGHSLGGALAVVATRWLEHDNIAACYTFGSPKVGNAEFGDAIKPPIYRVLNAADAVPRVPPSWTLEVGILLAKCIPIPYLRSGLTWLLEKFRGYRHHGDMRYLTDCKADFSDLRLESNPEQFDRIVWLVKRLATEWRAGYQDHAIARYCAKLERYALRRAEKAAALPRPTLHMDEQMPVAEAGR